MKYVNHIMIAITTLILAGTTVYAAEGTPGYGPQVFAGVKTGAKTYSVGEPVKISFIIENRSDKAATYHFSSGKQYDVWVERSGKEIWRLSHGKMYIMSLTSITIPAGESKKFETAWNQVDNDGKAVGPGTYTIKAQLTPRNVGGECVNGGIVACVFTTITVGSEPKVVPTSISALSTNTSALKGKLVSVEGEYRGWKADGKSAACKAGPPVSRTDWAVSDKTGCIYVHGKSGLDPTKDRGTRVAVMGRLMTTKDGQPYIEVRSVSVKPSTGSGK